MDKDVVVVAHEAEGQDLDTESRNCLCPQLGEQCSIAFIQVRRLSGGATVHDVVEGPWIVDTRFARHSIRSFGCTWWGAKTVPRLGEGSKSTIRVTCDSTLMTVRV